MDLYGRGYSDAAHKDTLYDHRLFVSLLAEVLLLLREETQGLSVEPIHLIGYRYARDLCCLRHHPVAAAANFPYSPFPPCLPAAWAARWWWRLPTAFPGRQPS